MNSLEIKDFNGKKVIDSRVVAERIDMLHKNLLQKIKGYEGILLSSKFSPVDFFIPSKYTDSTGRTLICYLLTKQGCEMVANKLTGEKGVLFTAEYVNAFNEMEKQIKELPKLPNSPQEILKLIVQANEQTDKKVEELRNDVDEKFNDMPLFNVECQEMEKAVRKKGTAVLGGYHSPAYNDRSTRTKVYEDIHKQVKREFGVNTYKAINRIHYGDAITIINNYSAPVVLREEINRINSQQCMDLNVDGGAK